MYIPRSSAPAICAVFVAALFALTSCLGHPKPGVTDAYGTQDMVQEVGTWQCPVKQGVVAQPYLCFTPAQNTVYSQLPLLIFLHGAGHRGNDVGKLEKSEVVKLIRRGRKFRAIVLCPQSPSYWTDEQAVAFVDQAQAKFAGKFDARRVYLTGESAGGGGVWAAAGQRAAVLAAAVPIATTGGKFEDGEALKELPIWAFHNAHDPYQAAEYSRERITAIHRAGGKYAFYTEYTETPGKQSDGIWPNAHRHAWETAYHHEPMWEWLFRQRKGEPQLALDPAPSPVVPPDVIPTLRKLRPSPGRNIEEHFPAQP